MVQSIAEQPQTQQGIIQTFQKHRVTRTAEPASEKKVSRRTFYSYTRSSRRCLRFDVLEIIGSDWILKAHFSKRRASHKMNQSLPSNSSREVTNGQRSLAFIATNVFLVVVIIFAVFGNTLVCLACVMSKRLQSFISAFIISLAVSDILVGAVSMPVWLSVNLTGKPDAVNFPTLYKAWLCFDIVCGTASIMNLVFISIDRFLAVNHPLRYRILVTRNRITIGIAFIWIYSVTIASINPLKWQGYPLFVSLASFFVPLLIMVVAYSRIFHVALTHARNIRRVHSDQSITHQRVAENFNRDVKAARTLSIVIGAFVACWCPFFVVTLVFTYCKSSCKVSSEVLVMIKWLHYGNSVLNPLIYSCLNRNFRAAFKDVLRRINVNRTMTHAHSGTTRQLTTCDAPHSESWAIQELDDSNNRGI